jgi:hypothetical protein
MTDNLTSLIELFEFFINDTILNLFVESTNIRIGDKPLSLIELKAFCGLGTDSRYRFKVIYNENFRWQITKQRLQINPCWDEPSSS